MLSAALWEALEHHGVTEAHLEMLLCLLQMQRNGSWAWHYVQGQLTQCDLRLTFPAREREVQRVCDGLVREPGWRGA